jgi:hypothetical protein
MVERLAASPGHFALVRAGVDAAKGKFEGNGRTGESIVAGEPGGAQAEALKCASDIASASVAIDGTMLAETGCSDDPAVELRDLGAPGVGTQRIAAAGGDAHIAGPYVAWRTPDAIVVYDRAAGAEAYRIALEHTQLPGPVTGFDLQSDGKVAIAMADPRDASSGAIAWASPAMPTPQLLAPSDGVPQALRIVGDRIVVRSRDGDPYSGPDNLQLLDLSGAVRKVARVAAGAGGGVDFDGTRIAWFGEQCANAVLHIADAGAPGAADDHTTHCPVQISAGRLALDHRRRTQIELTCLAPNPHRRGDACTGRLRLSTTAGRRLAQRRFRIRTDGVREVTVKLPRRAHPRRVRVVVVSRTRGHASTSRRTLRVGR